MAASSGETFAERLNYLIETVHPPDRGPFTDLEISEGITAQGGDVSNHTIGRLRSGKQDNPKLATVTDLAGFFGVAVSYFTDKDTTGTENAIALALVQRDTRLSGVLMRMGGLSPASLGVVADLVDKLRDIEQGHKGTRPADRDSQ
jgi:transcriptional regulator with XRE-family HTH domain